ncbi:MAG: hypothetical protein D6715_07090 [Calditrichaeota bacterium]|nr:MAG: hypothetical protein D6715_07090 [Calditrichota bacterium]
MSTVLTSLIIGFLSLDTTVAFQVLVSQPIFSCPLLGWLLGDLAAGFEMGLLMQLLWLGIIPAGARKYPEGNLASMVACVLVIQSGGENFPNLVFLLALLVALLVSYLGATLTVLDRRLNGLFFELARRAAEHGQLKLILALDVFSVALYLGLMSLLALASLLFGGWAIEQALALMPGFLEAKLALLKPAVLGIGTGFMARHFYLSWKRK